MLTVPRVAFRASAFLVGILTLCPVTFAQDATYNYQLRSNPNSSNRYEGLVGSKYASQHELRLVSFIAYREKLQLEAQPWLKMRFFVPGGRPVFLRAVELRRHGPWQYLMRPVENDWKPGWQEFTWPTVDVLVPLQIEPNDLGVVARLDSDFEGSGAVAPVILYANNYAPTGRYVAHFVPPGALASVYWELSSVDNNRILAKRQLCNEASQATPCRMGNVPFGIVLDLSHEPAGNYRLVVDTTLFGYSDGPSNEIVFRHDMPR